MGLVVVDFAMVHVQMLVLEVAVIIVMQGAIQHVAAHVKDIVLVLVLLYHVIK